MKKTGIVPRNILVDAALPSATATYTVISHGFIINSILATLDNKGFTVSKERYTCNENAQIATGLYHLNYGNDPDLGMLFAFSNSYNKLLRFRCAVGAFVKINDMSVLGEAGNAWIRKHTGTADAEALAVIEKQIDDCAVYFNQLADDKEMMKQIKLTKRQYGELIGRLYIDTKILSGEQIGVIKKEFENPSYAYSTDADSLWTLYNHILVALSKSHPRTWMEQQKIVHTVLMTEYNLVTFDDDDAILPETNQLDLEDVIAEVEKEQPIAPPVTVQETEVSQQEENEITEEVEEVIADTEVEVEEVVTTIEPVAEEQEEMPEEIEEAFIEESILRTEAEVVNDTPTAEVVREVIPEPIQETLPQANTAEARPKMTVEAALAAYGHLLSEDEVVKLKQLDPVVVAKMKAIITEQLKKTEETTKPAGLPVQTLPPVPVEDKEEEVVIPEPSIADTVEEIENITEAVVDATEDLSNESFLISKEDIEQMYPGVDLEAGFVVTINDIDFEIISITDTSYELKELKIEVVNEDTVEEIVDLDAEDDAVLGSMLKPIPHVPTEISLSERRAAIDAEIANQNAAEVSAIESESLVIGDPVEMAPAETMLNKRTPEEDKVDEIIATMESTPELTEEDKQIQRAIASEIFELYDEHIPFTYATNNNQYNVTLETGEVIILTEPYIMNLIGK
jgi:hypothetical protein